MKSGEHNEQEDKFKEQHAEALTKEAVVKKEEEDAKAEAAENVAAARKPAADQDGRADRKERRGHEI
jgi:hypothetical protein